MKLFIANFVFFITISFFIALYLWDKSHGGSGLRGILKIIRKLLKLMAAFFALIITFVVITAFIETGFWQWFFVVLVLPGPLLLCTTFNIGLFIFFGLIYANKK